MSASVSVAGAVRNFRCASSNAFVSYCTSATAGLLCALLACEDSKKGFGTTNWGEYCNPKMDVVLEQALSTVNDAERSKMLQEATAIAINDGGIIPIHQQVTTWATQKGIVYVDEIEEFADEDNTADVRTLTIPFVNQSEQVDILGTSMVLEFGAITAIVLAVAIVGIIAATAVYGRTRFMSGT